MNVEIVLEHKTIRLMFLLVSLNARKRYPTFFYMPCDAVIKRT